MRSRFLTAALAGVVVAGCAGGDVGSDRIPTAPALAMIDVTITPVGGVSIFVGATLPIATSGGLPTNGSALGAFARFNNGTGRYVEATWTSSDDSVMAVVDATLVVRARGTVTLTAMFEGRSDTEVFTAEGVAGRWAGSYTVEQCNANSGSMAEVLCGAPGRAPGLAAVGSTLPLSMEIAENDTDLAAVVSFGQVRGTLTGKNRGAGFFYLLGVVEGGGRAINITHWDMRLAGETMEGYLAYHIRIGGLPGIGEVLAKLATMTRE